MELILLIAMVVASTVAAVFLRHLALGVKALLVETKLLRAAIGDLGQPLYDTKRKQDEVLETVGKHGGEMLALLTSIRDLNTKDLTEKREILSQTNIKATSRVTSTREWIAKLEAEANREMLGLSKER